MTNHYTPEARLLGAGWNPGDELARLVLQRESLWAALAQLSTNTRNEPAIAQAVQRGDREGIVAAVAADAIGTWCDGQLQRFDTTVATWNAQLRNGVSALIAKDPQAVLDGLSDLEDPDNDAAAIRAEAAAYIEASRFLFGHGGRPAKAEAVKSYGQVIPRQVRPLVSRVLTEQQQRLSTVNRDAMTADAAAAIVNR